ncbi:unnamed protein product, partial [Phytomonas sp. Hart1]
MHSLACNSCFRRAVPLRLGLSAMRSTLAIPSSHSGYLTRWVSTPSICGFSTSTTNLSSASSGRKDQHIDDAMPPAASPMSTETETLTEQIRSLSDEDQRLIYNVLKDPDSQKSSVMGGHGIGPKGSDMVAAFTCGRCNYRMVKKFSKHAYTKGIVIVECSECRVMHLLADNLGWIDEEAKNIEDVLREKGEKFIRIGGSSDYQVLPAEEGDQ